MSKFFCFVVSFSFSLLTVLVKKDGDFISLKMVSESEAERSKQYEKLNACVQH